MQILDLFESAESDLSTVRIAQRASSKFSGWLHDHNENTPLKDCGLYRQRISNCDCWIIEATKVGIDDHHLYLGIGYSTVPTATQALVTDGWNGNKTYTYLIMLLPDDPSDKTDLAFSLRWEHFIHEYQHVLDYKRGYRKHRENMRRKRIKQGVEGIKTPLVPVTYFNSPVEFNGYWTQALSKILNELERGSRERNRSDFEEKYLRDFKDFQQFCRLEFEYSFLDYLNPLNQRKLTSRIAKLYQHVRSTWPDVPALQDKKAESAEMLAAWQAKNPDADSD